MLQRVFMRKSFFISIHANSKFVNNIYYPSKLKYRLYNHGQKLYEQLRKRALSLTPQAMYNQFKRPLQGVLENFTIFIERLKTKEPRSNESRDHYQEDGYLVPSPRCDLYFQTLSKL